jgi:hypothetical protein
MTGSVFLSWSTPDEKAILALKDRLLDVGLTVWEYKESSAAGGNIHQEIIKAINAVEVAIICFTDDTANRDWIVREAEWCFKTLTDGDKSLKHIIPVWVGDHPLNKVPPILNDARFNTKDLANPTSMQLEQFIKDLFQRLRREEPRVTPAALFAMTADQCQELFKRPAKIKDLSALCSAAGMKPGPNLVKHMSARYGQRAEDLAPFLPGETLLQLVNSLLRQANEIRIRKGRRPVMLKWMQDELVGPGQQQASRNEWVEGDSLLVVDAASSFHPDIQQRLLNLPQPTRAERGTLIWLPPYTQHTAPIEQTLQTATVASNIGHLGDAFSQWRERKSLRAVTFDTYTCTGAALWLRRALLDVEDAPDPVPTRVSSMRNAFTARFDLGSTMAGSPTT